MIRRIKGAPVEDPLFTGLGACTQTGPVFCADTGKSTAVLRLADVWLGYG